MEKEERILGQPEEVSELLLAEQRAKRSTPEYKKNARRYRLHYACRQKGFALQTRTKTLFVPYSKRDNLPKQAKRLQNEFCYALQLEIE